MADIKFCSELGIPNSTLSTFVKQRSKLENINNVAPMQKHARASKHHEIDEAVLLSMV